MSTESTTTTVPDGHRHVPHGHFCWFEVYSRDPKKAQSFYGAVSGWKAQPMEGMPGYDIFMQESGAVGGLMTMGEEFDGLDPHWMLYARVADLDVAMKRVPECGGSVCHGPMEVPDIGRFAIVDDATGGTLSLFESEESWRPAGPGGFCWTELFTNDIDKARTFYERVLGWTSTSIPGTDVQMFAANDEPVCSIEIVDEVERPGWLPYVEVADLAKVVEAITSNGGSIEGDVQEVPGGHGRYVWARDFQGARVGFYQGT